MADRRGPVLVIGATGQQGGVTARHLLERDRTVRALVRDPASSVLTPPQIAETFGRVCGLPARFRQTPIEQVRAFDVQLAQMFTFFNEHPSELADLPALRAEHPGLMRLETWLRETGWKP